MVKLINTSLSSIYDSKKQNNILGLHVDLHKFIASTFFNGRVSRIPSLSVSEVLISEFSPDTLGRSPLPTPQMSVFVQLKRVGVLS